MTKKKYKSIVSVVLLLLCVAPMIFSLVLMLNEGVDLTAFNITDFVTRFEISSDLSAKIGESLNTFGISFDGEFYPAVLCLMSNAILIYICYIFVAVLVWLPKFAIKLMERSVSYE